MKHRANSFLRALAKHFGLQVRFVDYFTDDIHGKLLLREKRILINAHKPRYEHVFTLLHELGHCALHFRNPYRRRHPRIFDLRWDFDFWTKLSSFMRRYYRYIFSNKSGKEWEADVWAICAFACFKRFIGRSDLRAFLNRHPEKKWIYRLAATGAVYLKAKKRIVTAFKLVREARHALSSQSSRPTLAVYIRRQPGLRSACVLVPSR